MLVLTLARMQAQSRPLVFPALALLLGLDTFLHQREPSRLVTGILDESAHALTAGLLVTALPLPRDEPFLRGVLAGAILIDLDHIPGEFGWPILTRGSGRPLVHSLPTITALLLAAAWSAPPRRSCILGATAGALTHLFRDMATGGAPLRWPLDKRRVKIPYGLYLALLSGAALRLIVGGRSRAAL